jgi:cytidylate kinase
MNTRLTETSNEILQVIECGGTARSGKGTMVADYAKRHDSIATEETGADYRTVAKHLLMEGKIEPSMPAELIHQRAAALGSKALTEVVASRRELVATYGSESLYAPDVSGIVANVSPVPEVRTAVKSGFIKRVEAVRDSDNYRALLVDGRNLGPVVDKIAGTELIMRTFVSCVPLEAAWRDCERRGIVLDSTEGKAELMKTLQLVGERNTADAERKIDPVKPDAKAIDYWGDDACFGYTLRTLASERGHEDPWKLASKVFSKYREFTDISRLGVGYLACETGRQVHFETTYFRNYEDPKGSMLQASARMFDEALGNVDLSAPASESISGVGEYDVQSR